MLDSTGSVLSRMVNSAEHCTENSGTTKDVECLHQLNDCKFFKIECASGERSDI